MLIVAYHHDQKWKSRAVWESISLSHFSGEEISRKTQGNGANELGAHARIRTGDLFLTKEMLYRLSYVGGLKPILSATN